MAMIPVAHAVAGGYPLAEMSLIVKELTANG